MGFDFSVLKEAQTIAALMLTGKILLATLVLHVVFGVPLALLMNNKKNWLINLLDFIVVMPVMFPPMVLGFFLLLLLGKKGIIGGVIYALFDQSIIFSFAGVLIASFAAGFPFMVKTVQSGINSMNRALIEVSYSLGKSRVETFFRVLLPNIKGSILTGMVLACGRSLGEVGITLMLGGNIAGKTETMSLAIYNAVFDGEYSKAFMLSLFLSLVSLGLFMGTRLLTHKNNHFTF